MQSQAEDQPMELMPVDEPRMAVTRRIRGFVVFAPCAAVLGLSIWLVPSSAGFGTHRELGLPPCGFLQQTGYPCPSCGMTTSFSDMAHGRIVSAFLAQPMGVVLFLTVALGAVVGFGELATGKNLMQYFRPGPWWAAGFLAGILLGWGFKIAYGLATGILPVR